MSIRVPLGIDCLSKKPPFNNGRQMWVDKPPSRRGAAGAVEEATSTPCPRPGDRGDACALLCLEGRGAARGANRGLSPWLASGTPQRPAGEHLVPGCSGCPYPRAARAPAMSPCPHGFFGAPPGPCRFCQPQAGRGIGAHWWLCRRLVMLGGSPCSRRGFPKGSFTRRQHGPGSSPHHWVPPLRAETSGGTSGNPKHLPAGMQDGRKDPLRSVRAFPQKRAAEHKCVCTRTRVCTRMSQGWSWMGMQRPASPGTSRRAARAAGGGQAPHTNSELPVATTCLFCTMKRFVPKSHHQLCRDIDRRMTGQGDPGGAAPTPPRQGSPVSWEARAAGGCSPCSCGRAGLGSASAAAALPALGRGPLQRTPLGMRG